MMNKEQFLEIFYKEFPVLTDRFSNEEDCYDFYNIQKGLRLVRHYSISNKHKIKKYSVLRDASIENFDPDSSQNYYILNDSLKQLIDVKEAEEKFNTYISGQLKRFDFDHFDDRLVKAFKMSIESIIKLGIDYKIFNFNKQ